MDDASTSANSGVQTRQKRILPSRLRRGGPGVGNCDADIMILETKRRQCISTPYPTVVQRCSFPGCSRKRTINTRYDTVFVDNESNYSLNLFVFPGCAKTQRARK